ncbi:SdrD B-like domain-containing protein, partial [Spirosoma litoris]
MTPSISGLSGGIYTLTIQDAVGCIASPLAVLPTPSNCTAPVFDLALKKTLAAGQSANVTPGSNVTFTVTIYNQGNVDATNVQVTDYIPTGLTLNDANWLANGSLATLTTAIASLSAGQSVTRTITFLVNANAPSSLTNTAEISSASNAQNLPDVDSTPDSNPNNDGTPINDDLNGNHKGNPADDEDDSDPEVITVSPTPVFDLALKKTLAAGQSANVTPGSNVTFTVTIYNQGNVDATNVQVTDYIPAGLTLNDAAWTANGSLATLNSVIASLPASQSVTRNITFLVNANAPSSLTNTAEISSASNAQNLPDVDSSPDNNPSNDGTPINDDLNGNHKGNPADDEDDSDPEVITVSPTPVFDLALTKKLAPGQSATVVAGSNVTFTVTVYNQGNVDATNVQVTDYIPTGLTLNDANWAASNGLATLNTAIASLSAGQSVTRTITFTVSSSFAGGSLTNTAEISSASNAQNLPDKDSSPDNNPNNDGTPVNDDTSGDHKNNPSQDEDDSDPETITVTPLKASLGDYVWYDNNKNGQQDANEPPAVGVTVTLYNATTNQPISTTVTDGTGHYLFTNLDPGTYYVVFTAPSGATFTTVDTGNDTTDSDAGVGGKTGNYTLAAGEQNLTVDAGLIPKCTSPNCFTTITVK